MAKASPSTSPPPGGDVIHRLAVDVIIPHPNNAREIFAGVPAIAASMKASGINDTPVRVRPHPTADPSAGKDRCYQLIYGEQRWRAAKRAKLLYLRAEIVEATDAEALAMMLRENFARSDLHPIEEANAIQMLVEQGRSHEEIAAEYGVSRRIVARRARLTALTPAWRKRLKDAKEYIASWPVRFFELIATLEPETQDLLLAANAPAKGWGQFKRADFSYRELERVVAHATHELARAPWPLKDDALVPKAGSCLACKKRSACRPELFDEKELGEAAGGGKKLVKGDRCLDLACWNQKAAAQIQRREAELKKEHGKVVRLAGDYNETGNAPGDEALAKGAASHYDYVPAKKGDKGAVPAIVVTGSRAGVERFVKPRPEWGGSSSGARERKALGLPTPLSERKARLTKRRDTWVCQKVCDAIEKRKRVPTVDELLGLAAACGTRSVQGSPVRVSNMSGLAHRLKRDALWEVLWPELVSCCRPTYSPPLKMAKAIASVLAIDFAAFATQVLTEIPTPKGWAKLNANGTPKKAATKAKAKAKGNGAKKAAGKKPKRGKRAKARKATTPRRGPKKPTRKARKGRKA